MEQYYQRKGESKQKEGDLEEDGLGKEHQEDAAYGEAAKRGAE